MYSPRARGGSDHTDVRADVVSAQAVEPSRQGGGLALLLGALDELRGLVDTDVILRRTVEIARDRLGVRRARIFMLDRSRNLLLGTWGMAPSGAVVDEHHLVSALSVSDREALLRAEDGIAHFTVFEDSPRIAKTPIRSSQAILGMMFNDAGAMGDTLDEAKQEQVAVLCSMLGTMLDPVRGWRVRCGVPPGSSPGQRLVAATVEMLDKNPGLGTKSMAADLGISESRLGALFKTLMGMSLVEYRNLLRLERFEALVDSAPASLIDAALAAGFGSYAQFHRVFRAQLHTTPRQYVRASGGYRSAAGARDGLSSGGHKHISIGARAPR